MRIESYIPYERDFVEQCLFTKKEKLHDTNATQMHGSEVIILGIYLRIIDIFLIGTNHGRQFGVNVVWTHTLNISKILKFSLLLNCFFSVLCMLRMFSMKFTKI